MVSEERAQIAANNKSLRIIKNELEALAERGFITDEQYDTIINTLPAEASLNISRPTPSTSTSNTSALHGGFGNDRSQNASPSAAPPSYSQAQAHPPPPPPPRHKEVAHATALWQYNTPDARDLNLQPGDSISVTEFMNPEWWLGKNVRTGEEGIFPSNYVRREAHPSTLAQPQHQQPAGNEYYSSDQKYYPGQQQQQQQPYQPQAHDPYAGPVPPMQIAEQPTEGKSGKGAEMGKKFGKKLGNAAIFGAGATIGGNIVNSIF